MAKVALRFGCAKQSKNLEWCLIYNFDLDVVAGISNCRPVYFYLFGRNGTGIVQIVLGKVRKFRAA